MASLRTLTIPADLGSEEVVRLRKSYNALLDVLGTLLDSLETATLVTDVNAAATAALASLETDATGVIKIDTPPSIPVRPAMPVKS
jgi:hypothetical protein